MAKTVQKQAVKLIGDTGAASADGIAHKRGNRRSDAICITISTHCDANATTAYNRNQREMRL
jgi:hypothetical protein